MLDIEPILVFPSGRSRDDFLRADDIWDFLPGPGNAAEGGAKMEEETIRYQEKYQTLEGARDYNVGYRERKQRRTKKEYEILSRLLKGKGGTVLDIPCGGGRLTPVIAESADAVIEMDLSLGQLQYDKEYCEVQVPRAWVRGSGFSIPLKDRSVDGVVCIRLSHHLHSYEEKERLIAELLRVASRFVVFSFVDSGSIKYTLRKVKSRLTGIPRMKNAIAVHEVKEIAARHGGRLIDCPAIGPLQAHRYALIEKTADSASTSV